MIGIKQALQYFSAKRLSLRVRQIADYALDPNATVYPEQLEFAGAPQRVVVLTPHADDETFGAGGTLLRHRERGDDITVLLVSDNAASIDDEEFSHEEKRSIREKEFATAMDMLGIRDYHSFGIRNSDFTSNVYPKMVFQHLIENKADVLYLPSLFDNHIDHRVLNIWLLRTLRENPTVRPLIRGFEVWSPLPATAVANITQYIDRKREAMHCYGSQQDAIDYVHHLEGLNAYRAITFGKSDIKYAEAFLELRADAYLELGKSLLL